MAANAEALKIPKGVTLWCDAEWNTPEKRPPKGDRLAYLNEWSRAVKLAGYSSIGLYVGAGVDLTGDELYALKRFKRYWKSLSSVPVPTVRGYCLSQSWEYVLLGKSPRSWHLKPMTKGNKRKGQRVDLDLSTIDGRGSRFYWIER